MRTVIKSVTVITAAKNKTYTVGETYNGLVLDHVKNHCSEFEDQVCVNFTGYTEYEAAGPVFEIYNAALDVQYEAVEE